MSRIRLILLDFDGTLVDTRRANARAYVETLREVGYAMTEEEYAARHFGVRCPEFLRSIGIDDPAEIDRLRRRKIELYPATSTSWHSTVRCGSSVSNSGNRAAACGSSRRASVPTSTT